MKHYVVTTKDGTKLSTNADSLSQVMDTFFLWDHEIESVSINGRLYKYKGKEYETARY